MLGSGSSLTSGTCQTMRLCAWYESSNEFCNCDNDLRVYESSNDFCNCDNDSNFGMRPRQADRQRPHLPSVARLLAWARLRKACWAACSLSFLPPQRLKRGRLQGAPVAEGQRPRPAGGHGAVFRVNIPNIR